jgi:hypothetical protein
LSLSHFCTSAPCRQSFPPRSPGCLPLAKCLPHFDQKAELWAGNQFRSLGLEAQRWCTHHAGGGSPPVLGYSVRGMYLSDFQKAYSACDLGDKKMTCRQMPGLPFLGRLMEPECLQHCSSPDSFRKSCWNPKSFTSLFKNKLPEIPAGWLLLKGTWVRVDKHLGCLTTFCPAPTSLDCLPSKIVPARINQIGVGCQKPVLVLLPGLQ